MKTLLVVDHDAENLDYIRDLLKDSDFASWYAENPEAARLRADLPAGPDLLLAALPSTLEEGGDTAERLAAAYPGSRIVLMSPHPIRWLERNGLRALGIPLLQKPFSRVRLLEALESAWETTQADGPAPEASPSLEQAA